MDTTHDSCAGSAASAAFAHHLGRLLGERGMTRYALARATGLTQTGLANVLAGSDVRLSTATLIARALGAGLAEMLAPPPAKKTSGKIRNGG